MKTPLLFSLMLLGACQTTTESQQTTRPNQPKQVVSTHEALDFFEKACGKSLPDFASANSSIPQSWVKDSDSWWRSNEKLLRIRTTAGVKRNKSAYWCSITFATYEDTAETILNQRFPISEGTETRMYRDTVAEVSFFKAVTSGGPGGPDFYSVTMRSIPNK